MASFYTFGTNDSTSRATAQTSNLKIALEKSSRLSIHRTDGPLREMHCCDAKKHVTIREFIIVFSKADSFQR